MIDLLIAIVIGFVIGLLARFLLPGDDKMGFILTTLCGVLGGVLGKYIAPYIPLLPSGSIGHFIASTIGAILILVVLRIVRR